MSHSPYNLSRAWLVVISGVAFSLIGIASWVGWRQADLGFDAAVWLARTHEIDADLNQIEVAANAVQADVRAYAITGDLRHVRAMEGNIQVAATLVEALRGKIADVEAARAFELVAAQLNHVFERARSNIEVRERAGAVAAQAAATSVDNAALMQRANTLFRRVHDRESLLLQRRTDVADRARESVARIEFLTGGVSIMLLALVIVLLFRSREQHKLTVATLRAQSVELQRAKRDAEAADSAKTTFLATVSHEIRTPLNGLLGMLELLSLKGLDAEAAESLKIASYSGHMMRRLVDDILDQARILSGKLLLVPEPVSVAQLLPRVVNIYSAVASSKGLVIKQSADPRIGHTLLADSLRLMQVLGNFISNAIKFTDAGYVEVRAEFVSRTENSETVCFSVTDTGIGITPEQQHQLFQPFFQASPVAAARYGGTGLGLSISRRLADLMGGAIALQSAVGVGTTLKLTLTLPIATDTSTTARLRQLTASNAMTFATSPDALPRLQVAWRGARVMVVDDNPINRLLLSRQLALLGMTAECVVDGRSAIDSWRAQHFELVITDCNMPEIDGYELARAIRDVEEEEGRPRTVIIGWTANAQADAADRSLAAGMDGLLRKPTDMRSLVAALNLSVPAKPKPAVAQAASVNAANGATRHSRSGGWDMRGEYIRYTQADLHNLSAAVARGDVVATRHSVHRIKGSSLMAGVAPIAHICETIETVMAGSDGGTMPASIEGHVADIEQALRDFGSTTIRNLS
jgi:signal transduction histidine kinase/DNA-binding response OmpR family regulator